MSRLALSDLSVLDPVTHMSSVVDDLVLPDQAIGVWIGRNGAGKSLLLRAVAGRAEHRGRIMLGSAELERSSALDRMRRGLVLVAPKVGHVACLSVHDHLRLSVHACAPNAATHGSMLQHLYCWFPRLHERSAERASSLERFDRALLSLACGLAWKPAVMLVDEITYGLTHAECRAVAELLRWMRDRLRITFLISEENPRRAFYIADIVWVLDAGRVIAWSCPGAPPDPPPRVPPPLGAALVPPTDGYMRRIRAA